MPSMTLIKGRLSAICNLLRFVLDPSEKNFGPVITLLDTFDLLYLSSCFDIV